MILNKNLEHKLTLGLVSNDYQVKRVSTVKESEICIDDMLNWPLHTTIP